MNFANMVGENLSVVKMGSSIEFQQWFPLRKTPLSRAGISRSY